MTTLSWTVHLLPIFFFFTRFGNSRPDLVGLFPKVEVPENCYSPLSPNVILSRMSRKFKEKGEKIAKKNRQKQFDREEVSLERGIIKIIVQKFTKS